jgi:hypothetical protein
MRWGGLHCNLHLLQACNHFDEGFLCPGLEHFSERAKSTMLHTFVLEINAASVPDKEAF